MLAIDRLMKTRAFPLYKTQLNSANNYWKCIASSLSCCIKSLQHQDSSCGFAFNIWLPHRGEKLFCFFKAITVGKHCVIHSSCSDSQNRAECFFFCLFFFHEVSHIWNFGRPNDSDGGIFSIANLECLIPHRKFQPFSAD